MLKRAIWTYQHIADEIGINWVTHHKDWRLNEKHYGDLQGLAKKDVNQKGYSQDLLDHWRYCYEHAPPELHEEDPRHPKYDRRYKDVPTD